MVSKSQHAAGQTSAASIAVTGAAQPGYTPHKQALLKRLARIEGQARGIKGMVEQDRYCIDVLTQISAVTKAMQAVALELLEEHMAHCLVDAVEAGGGERDAKLREASDAIARLVRS
jgi:DNA-binding FrmR family transcriptional regulator